MNWRFAFRSLAAELRRRETSVRSTNNPMVKCGAVKAEVADAQACVYNWLASDLEYLIDERHSSREALAKIRRWATLDRINELVRTSGSPVRCDEDEDRDVPDGAIDPAVGGDGL